MGGLARGIATAGAKYIASRGVNRGFTLKSPRERKMF